MGSVAPNGISGTGIFHMQLNSIWPFNSNTAL